MNWLQRYRFRHFVRNSIWIYPIASMVVAMIAVRLLHWIDETMGWQGDLNPETTRNVLGTLAGAMFTFIVFVCSSLLLVVQLASAQLTPRAIGTMFRDMVTKLTLSVFVFNFTFALAAMMRIGETVPLLTGHVGAYGCLASIAIFLYLIDHIGKLLRPNGILSVIATQAHGVIEHVYPRRLTDSQATMVVLADELVKRPARAVKSTTAGVVLAFDVKGLVKHGTKYDCVIEMMPQVGNFVAPGDTLFRIHGDVEFATDALLDLIALGAERTVEQDPTFAFRVIVDIASKGLSPAINDPTTAVLALDRIHHLLRHVGGRRLDNEKVRDQAGRLRLIYRTPDWEDFVVLAVTEIRQFGASSIQIARRLHAMLEDLIQTLPEERAAALRRQLQLLNKSVERCFPDPEDRVLAGIQDAQGMGGAHVTVRHRVT